MLQIPEVVLVAVREDDEAAVLRAGVCAGLLLANEGVLVLGLGLQDDERESSLASRSRKSMKPLEVFSKSSPRSSRSDALIVTPVSRQMLAGLSPSAKKRQPAASSSLLILMREAASFMRIQSVERGIRERRIRSKPVTRRYRFRPLAPSRCTVSVGLSGWWERRPFRDRTHSRAMGIQCEADLPNT